MKIHKTRNEALQSCIHELGLQSSSICLRNTEDNKLWSYVTEIHKSIHARKFAGSGVDFSPRRASIKAMAESIERYFLYTPDDRMYVSGFKKNIPYMSTDMWPTFLDEQISNTDFNYKKYIVDNIRHWVSMRNISTEDELLIPASLVWLSPFNDRFSPGVSSGTACHFDKKQALLYSIYEVVERDAFSIFWESMTQPPSLNLDSVPFFANIQYLIQKLIDKQFAIKIFDITTELNIPVYCVIIYSKLGIRPNLSVGAACNLDRLTAISKAIIEAYQTWSWMCEEVIKNNLSFSDCLSRLRNPDDMMFHPLLYTFKESRKYCDFLLCNTEHSNDHVYEEDDIEIEDKLNYVLNILSDCDFQAYYHDIGNNITTSYSLAVTRVIIPGMVPLSIGQYGKHYANTRIKEIPGMKKWLGHENIVLNPNPHPFP